MLDGCPHSPPSDIPDTEVLSYIRSELSTNQRCVVTSDCDSAHVFEVRNFHLYPVVAHVNASAVSEQVAVCSTDEDPSKLTQWKMDGTVPAAPYRPRPGEPKYGQRLLTFRIHATSDRSTAKDTISIDPYSIESDVNGSETGGFISVPVLLV